MTKEADKSLDQAEELRKLINEVETKEVNHQPIKDKNEPKNPEVDILNLPPRKEVHHNKKKTLNFKMSKSVIRLLFVIVIALAIVLSVIYLNENNTIDFNSLLNN